MQQQQFSWPPCSIAKIAINAATFAYSLRVLWYARTHVVPPLLTRFQALNSVVQLAIVLDSVARTSGNALYTALVNLVLIPPGLVAIAYLLEWMTNTVHTAVMMPTPRWFGPVLAITRTVLPSLAFTATLLWAVFQTERFEGIQLLLVGLNILLTSTVVAAAYITLLRNICAALAPDAPGSHLGVSMLKRSRAKALAFAVFWLLAPNGFAIWLIVQSIPRIASSAASTTAPCTSMASTVVIALLFLAVVWVTFRRGYPLRGAAAKSGTTRAAGAASTSSSVYTAGSTAGGSGSGS